MEVRITLTFIAWCLSLCIVQSTKLCTTPTGVPGSCKSLNDCKPLKTIAENPLRSQEELNLLRSSTIPTCGFQGIIPGVCCPKDDLPLPATCFTPTPDAQEGKCVELNSCQHLVTLSSQNNEQIKAFIQNSKCDENRVCCGNQAPNFSPPQNRECSSTVETPYPQSGCCGIESNSGDRIIGGTDASIYQYPWMALIEYNKQNNIKLLCGGVLISGRYVLTAGHCVVGPVLNYGTPRRVRLGEHDTSNDPKTPDCVEVAGGGKDCSEGSIAIPIEKVIAHEEYSPSHRQRRHDIALLRLTELAPYTHFIRPICLPQTDVTLSNLSNIYFFVAGWGAINETHSKSLVKQYVDLPYRNKDQCQPAYKIALWNGQLCAGGEPKKDSCKGDSGGPLMYKIENKQNYELVGIVSFGPTPCGIEDVPGVYTKVYEYLPWIRKNIKP